MRIGVPNNTSPDYENWWWSMGNREHIPQGVGPPGEQLKTYSFLPDKECAGGERKMDIIIYNVFQLPRL
jgi:hypothetical protein